MDTLARVRATSPSRPAVLPAALQAALGCPRCHARLSASLHCSTCDFHLIARDGLLFAAPEPAGQRFSAYSESSGLPQYLSADLHEQPYYLRFLPDWARLVADCGGGDANATAQWARLHPQAQLAVLDMDRWALSKAISRQLPNLTAICGPAASLPFATGTVDVIFSSYMVEHMFDWELGAFYREVFRSLRPGGQFIVQSGAAFFDKYIHPALRLIRQRTWRTSRFLEKWNTNIRALDHHNLKTPRAACSMLTPHGFTTLGMEVPLLFSNRLAFAAFYEAASGLLPMPWIERFLATSYTIVAAKP